MVLLAGMFLFLSVSPARAQDQGYWKVFLRGNDVQGLTARGEDIWAATSGGVVRMSPSGQFAQWCRGSQGPLSDSVVVATTDLESKLWFGTVRSGISVFDPEAERWRAMTSLLESISGDQIQRIRIAGSAGAETVMVATATGFAVFVNGDLRSTCQEGTDICGLPSFDVRDLLTVGNEVWIATASGMVAQRADGSWLDRSPGLQGAHLVRLVRADSLYTAGADSNQIWVWRGAIWARVANPGAIVPSDLTCSDLLAKGDTLWMAGSARSTSQSGVFRRLHGSWTRVGGALVGVTSVARTPGGALYAGCSDPYEQADGIWKYDGAGWIQRRFEGPGYIQHYRSLQFDADGALWLSAAVSGYSPRLIRYEGGRWTTYPGGKDGRLNAWTFRILEAGHDLWLGHCCCRVPEDLCRIERVRDHGERFLTWPVNNAADLDLDDRGDIWAATYHDNDNITHAHGIYRVRPSDSTSVQIIQETESRMVSNQVRAIRVDGRVVWVGYFGSGISRWDLGPDREPMTSDDQWRSYTETSGVPIIGNNVRVIAIGPDSKVWIGTTAGLSIYDGVRFANVGSGFGRLPTAEVTSILPTSDGGAWVGTREGGLTRMTKRALGGYNYLVYSPPLLPNPSVEAIALDPDGRTLWLGTARGLASFVPPRTSSVTSDQGDIGAYPNPFQPACVDGLRLTGISGMVRGVVSDLAGKVVAEFPAGGGNAALQLPGDVIWDGRVGNHMATPGLYWIRVQTSHGVKSLGVAVVDGDCGN
jgi:hypothetical protein